MQTNLIRAAAGPRPTADALRRADTSRGQVRQE
jgi:hypothetical protein